MSTFPSFQRYGSFGMAGKIPLPKSDISLEGERVSLRLGHPLDWQNWRDLRIESRDFLTPWEPTWPADGLTFDFYSTNLAGLSRDWKEDKAYAFHVFLRKDKPAPAPQASPSLDKGLIPQGQKSFLQRLYRPPHHVISTQVSAASGDPAVALKKPSRIDKNETLIGGIALTDIQRGAAQKGTLGYWIGAPHAGKGLMTEAARLVMIFGFEKLRLHRLEASCMPHNEPSKHILQTLGFSQEGTSPSYLRINGKWEDHIRWGKTNPEGV